MIPLTLFSTCGVGGGQSGIRRNLSPSTLVSPWHCHSANVLYLYFIHLPLHILATDNTDNSTVVGEPRYEVLPKISENLNIRRKPLALRTCAASCLFLYLSTVSQPTGVFISACVSEFWLFSLHRFHVYLLIQGYRKRWTGFETAIT